MNKTREETVTTLKNIINKFTDYFSDTVDNNHIPENLWHYIPYPFGFLLDDLKAIKAFLNYEEKISIIEVGCGIGVNAYFMKKFFKDAYVKGIDIDSKTLEIGSKIFESGVDYQFKDAMDEDYSQFDIIFFYMPFSIDEEQQKFEEKIYNEAKKGAIVFSGMFEHKIEKEDIEFITPEIYKKL